MLPAPIAIFAFNRPQSLRRLFADLTACRMAAETQVYVFVDGPRNEADRRLVDETIACCESLPWPVTLRKSDSNRGLANSIIAGVTEVVEHHGRVIVLEDDLRIAPNLLEYMNQMLEHYESDGRVFQISGFGLKVTPRKDYEADVYFHTRAASWGWATWKDRWATVDWQVRDYDKIRRNPLARWRLNRIGSDVFGMLRAWKEGRNNSWAIRFTYAMYRQSRYAVTPIRSLTRNEGFGTDATNCTDNNFYTVEMDDGQRSRFATCDDVRLSRPLSRQATAYFGLWSRFLNGRKLRRIKSLLNI